MSLLRHRQAFHGRASRVAFLLTLIWPTMLFAEDDIAGSGALEVLAAMRLGATEQAAVGDAMAKAAADDGAAALAVGNFLVAERRSFEQVALGITFLERAAELGLSDANRRLGDIYSQGFGSIPQQAERAVGYYKAAAAAGDNAARRTLASMLIDSNASFFDPAAAATHLEHAVAAGDASAAVQLGQLVAQDATRPDAGPAALALFQRAIVAGNTGAFHAAGDLLRRGAPGLVPDPAAAFAAYEAIAVRGDNWARRKLAELHIRGEGTAPDHRKGAAILGHVSTRDPWAHIQLGDLFSRGEFAPIDAKKAIEAYEAAAEAGLVDGAVRLGDFYRNGAIGFPADAARAIEAYERGVPRRAADSNTPLLRLAEYHRWGGTGLAAHPQKAREYYELAVERGDNAARRGLASLLMDGALGERHYEQAIALLAAAAADGDSSSALDLGLIYARGTGIAADYAKAEAMVEQAAALGRADARFRFAVALMDGPLALTHASDGVTLLTDAVAAGVPGAVVEFTRLGLAGKIPGTRAGDALSLLRNSALAGDDSAARYLLQLYRDGSGQIVRPDPAAAEVLLADLSHRWSADSVTQERVLIEARRAGTAVQFAELADAIGGLERNLAIATLRQLARLNENAYLFAIQQRLEAFGYFGDLPSGILTGETVAAFRRACEAAAAISVCDRGPLTPEAVTLLTEFLYAMRPQS